MSNQDKQRKRIRKGINRMLVCVTDDSRFLEASKELFPGKPKMKREPVDRWAAIRAEVSLIV